jgi:predicted alpha/beta superfamily hydrolase
VPPKRIIASKRAPTFKLAETAGLRSFRGMSRAAFNLTDPRTETIYHVYVEREAEASGPLPAVLFMDGDDQFEPAINGYRAARTRAAVPPLLLVGVGYGASYTKPGNRRVRDYTPTALATEAGSGGADGFLAFLTDTLWPALSERYAVRHDVRGLAGHSLGSLLVVYAMLHRPLFFNRMLASAPSLWWDDRAVLCQAQRAQRTGAAVPARLFLSVGDEDTASMTTDLQIFEQQLATAPFPELEVVSRTFPGRNHYNVLEDAFAEGLSVLFSQSR